MLQYGSRRTPAVSRSVFSIGKRVNFFAKLHTIARKFNSRIITVIQLKQPPQKFSPAKNTRYTVCYPRFYTNMSCTRSCGNLVCVYEQTIGNCTALHVLQRSFVLFRAHALLVSSLTMAIFLQGLDLSSVFSSPNRIFRIPRWRHSSSSNAIPTAGRIGSKGGESGMLTGVYSTYCTCTY